MHEMGIIKNVMDSIEKVALENGIEEIKKIKLIIGKQRAVMPEALFLGFEAFRKNTMFQTASLEIENKDPLYVCESCTQKFNADFANECPFCKSAHIVLIEGDELVIDHFEF